MKKAHIYFSTPLTLLTGIHGDQRAFQKAQAEDKPIFLSIGYSACHWCHVMEKECFEDEQVANLLNEAFVCIKVDREERPDLDAAFMAVCQAMGRNCGWPLNILLTPKLNPFLAASYIPKFSTPGAVGIIDLIPQVMQVWKTQRQQAEMVGADIKARIQAIEKRTSKNQLNKDLMQDAFDRLKLDFDQENGGFGSAPKFPTPHKLIFLLRYSNRTGDQKALTMVEKTLNNMRQGGIYDQVGFGFHRYSTDSIWLVPHFEKMLYDQAFMIIAYIEAFQATKKNRFALAAQEIISYVTRDLSASEGGFYSAQDADSEGEEGKFYIWTIDQILDNLPAADAELVMHIFGMKPEGNFPGAKGNNILHFAEPLEELAPYEGLTLQELIDRIHSIRQKLFEIRKKRVPPTTDEKILTDWNGMIIAALAKAGKVLNQPDYLETAKRTADFLLVKMREGNLLFHRYAKGEKAIEGMLDDYAFLAFGLIELYEATFEDKFLQSAAELAKAMVERFWDNENGGFFQTQVSQANLPKIKQLYDGATPSGNSAAFQVLLLLSRLTNEPKYEKMAIQMTKIFAEELEGTPDVYTFFLSAIGYVLGPSYSVVVVGNLNQTGTVEMINALKQYYFPISTISLKDPTMSGVGNQQIEGKATAYVCRDQTCLPATNSIKVMLEQLGLKMSVK